MRDLDQARHRMVQVQLARRGIRNRAVLDAMGTVRREQFLRPGLAAFAYDDAPLAIAEGQTISQPYIVALMLEKADIGPGDTVLEVGTGSGYAAAVMSRIAGHVHTIERHRTLADEAASRFAEFGYDNIDVRTGDGTKGWLEAAPFDAIVVTAGGPVVPQALKRQLRIGGRLIIPIGGGRKQQLLRITRTGDDTYEQEDLGGVYFVPLIEE